MSSGRRKMIAIRRATATTVLFLPSLLLLLLLSLPRPGAPSSSDEAADDAIVAISCPVEESTPIELPHHHGGVLSLARSDSLCILTRAFNDTSNNGGGGDGGSQSSNNNSSSGSLLSKIAPVALSYDGRPWQVAAGRYATELLRGQEIVDYDVGHDDVGYNNSDGRDRIDLPAPEDGYKYYLTTSSHYYASERDEVARFLETATFGTTSADVDEWIAAGWVSGASADVAASVVSDDAVKDWIVDQMENKAKTGHREFFRRRANPRLAHPLPIARPDRPCDTLSRWRTFALARDDSGRRLEAIRHDDGDDENDDAGYIAITVDGHLRTVVAEESLQFEDDDGDAIVLPPEFQFGKEYKICDRPDELEGGPVRLRGVDIFDGSCEGADDSGWSLRNPPVQFLSATTALLPPNVLDLPAISEGVLERIDEDRKEQAGGYILLNGLLTDAALCSRLADVDDPPVFGRLPGHDGPSWLQFDPRMVLLDNSPESPIPDGGGLNVALSGGATMCANSPRTFANEGLCVLSDSPTACGSSVTPDLTIGLESDDIVALHEITGRYVYAILGLPLRDVDGVVQPSPCEPGLRSRWEIVDAPECSGDGQTAVGDEAHAFLAELLVQQGDEEDEANPHLRDIVFPDNAGITCGSDVTPLVEAEIVVGDRCFRRVHPDHMSVYDFTHWTLEDTHPGNVVAAMNGRPNPITKWSDVDGSAFLSYPSEDGPGAHPIHRWDVRRLEFPKLGRYGDAVRFVDLPNELRLGEVAEEFGGADAEEFSGGSVVVCGSPGEYANDPRLGQVFEVATGDDKEHRQREYVWMQVGLVAPDQLRQRVAWALSQILVVAEGAIGVQGSHTEAFLGYYDHFVDNAFGNYRDLLRAISYSPMMGENLTYLQSKSAAYAWENEQRHSFADENYAREIMQLFTTGLVKLNLDGTPVLDNEGNTIPTYTNDEIMSLARIWTGFDYQAQRGNFEESSSSGNHIDPMKIEAGWRDQFPKTDMTGGYIGDGYPLCVDLPDKMFLRKGATYRLIGSSHMPELMDDNRAFRNDPTLRKLVLDSNSSLKSVLCNEDINGNCQYSNSVTLEHTLSCTATECDADTLRVVQVNEEGIHYEYVRPPCVEHVFYSNATKVTWRGTWAHSSCANPLLPHASEACCEDQNDRSGERHPDYLYDQERVKFSSAISRCVDIGMEGCDFKAIGGGIAPYKKGFHWTPVGCTILVKVNFEGQTALVYEPDSYESLPSHLKSDNRNFFKVYWDGEWPKNDNDGMTGNSCGDNACESLATGGCLCSTVLTESRVFEEMPSSVDEVLSSLHQGAFDPSAYDEGTYMDAITENGVTAYLSSATGAYDSKTVFEVVDKYDRIHRFKNTKEKVHIDGASQYTFRNAPSFMSVLNTEATARDAHYETEAALDHYFYHDSTAPFISVRLIQRFTTSNPTPWYVKAVATAFCTGSYEGIGSGDYGDLAATIAAVFLDSEARSVNLQADPFRGNLREPLLRVMSLIRGMELREADGQSVVKMKDLDRKIGQMAHAFPSVFSFMLPEYVAGGRPGDATLVSPEAMIMDMPKVVGLLNGMFAMVKYGLSKCHGGFGTDGNRCNEGDFSRANAHLSFSRPYDPATTTLLDQAESVVGELSTILTSGRLSVANKETIKGAYMSKLNDTEVVDPSGSALRLAQQLVLTTPEFHTTNLVDLTGSAREQPAPLEATGRPYKAIVNVLFQGGSDSYQMLVPHTCTGEKDMYAEYLEIRQDIALDKNSLLLLKPVESQVCETFGVHPHLPTVQQLFNDDDLLFFANTGDMTKETDKENYARDTQSELFAHNHMQRAAQMIDPFKVEEGTGIMGRIRDALVKEGLNVGAFSLDVNSISVLGEHGVSTPSMILSSDGIAPFNEEPSSDDMEITISSLNGNTRPESSGVFGEWYSDKLVESLFHNQLLHGTLSNTNAETKFPESRLGKKLEMVSKMIDSRNERGTDADVFFVEAGGWDTHSAVLGFLDALFADVDASFKAFADEMKAKNLWDSVVLIQTSDFARTLTPNTGQGTDHAWAGQYMMMGGSVKGGHIVGTYPDDISDNGPLNIGRGRFIPTTSWEAVFLPLAEWAGVAKAGFDYVCPNWRNFPVSHFIEMTDLFESAMFPTLSPTNSPITSEPTHSPTSSPSAAPSTHEPSSMPTNAPVKSPPLMWWIDWNLVKCSQEGTPYWWQDTFPTLRDCCIELGYSNCEDTVAPGAKADNGLI